MQDYDEAGDYVRTWCPELSKVPSSHVHEPFKMSNDQQQQTGCVIGQAYPAPIPRSAMTPPYEHGDRGGRGGGRGGRGETCHIVKDVGVGKIWEGGVPLTSC